MTSLEKPLWSFSAGELVAAYRNKSATPSFTLEAIITRIAALNPRLNAIVTLDAEGAARAAEVSSARWRSGRPLGPLDGVPVTIKDNLYVRGMRATWGSRLFEHFVADEDDIVVQRLRDAGCIILGKTNTPELAMAGHTNSPVFGATANPWSPDYSPGGSSGGAVCAVAAGFCPIAIGTDSGGSIRRPAGFSGVVGLKPTIGRIPRRHGFPSLSHDLQVVGGVSRCVADMRTLFETVADAAAKPGDAKGSKLRIALVRGVETSPVDSTVSDVFDRAIDTLRKSGHELVEIEAPWRLDEVGRIFNTIASVGIARAVSRFPNWEHVVTPGLTGEAKDGLKYTLNDYLDILDSLGNFRWRMLDAMAQWDVIATPSAACAPWPIEDPYAKKINGIPASPRMAGVFSVAINLAGFPAIVVPAPRDSKLPITGLQLIGPPGQEEKLFDLAEQYEAHSPWPQIIP